MNASHGTRLSPDAAKLITAILAVTALFAVMYMVYSTDGSSAESTDVDGKTYFYDQLSDIEKNIYDEFPNYEMTILEKEGVEQECIQITIDIDSSLINGTVSDASSVYSTAVSRVSSALLYDKPEYCWLGKSWYYNMQYTHDGDTLLSGTVTFGCYGFYLFAGASTVGQNIAQHDLEAKVTEIHDAATASDTASRYATLKYIHDYICDNVEYDTTLADGMWNRNAYTALVADNSVIDTHDDVVCEGYARAFKILCDSFDIPCLVITGSGVDKDDNAEGHMWNIVQMTNGKWYLVDCTWDDQESISYTYFLVGSDSDGFYKKVSADHIVDTEDYTGDNFTVATIESSAYVDDKFTVTFLDYDGSVIETQTDLSYETEITAPTATYTDDNVGTFTFNSWSPTFVSTVTGDATYTATYDIVYVEYSVIFYSDGEQYSAKTDYHYGDLVSIPANPSKAASTYFTYTFTGWSPSIDEGATVTGNAEYNAVYECTGNVEATDSYTLTSTVLSEISSADKFSVTIKNTSGTAIAKIVFNKNAIAGLVADQTLTVTQATTEAVAESLREQLSEATIYQIDFGSNNDKFSSGTATVSLYYVKTALDAIGGMNLYYVNGETLETLAYNYADNYITFETSHFSTYAINNAMGLSGFMWYLPIIGILIFAFIGFALAYRFS